MGPRDNSTALSGSPDTKQIDQMILAINNLASAIERSALGSKNIAHEATSRYNGDTEATSGIVTEADMAQVLRMKPRTLGHHRRQGRFPGCWIRNGRRILWLVEATVAAWQKGIG